MNQYTFVYSIRKCNCFNINRQKEKLSLKCFWSIRFLWSKYIDKWNFSFFLLLFISSFTFTLSFFSSLNFIHDISVSFQNENFEKFFYKDLSVGFSKCSHRLISHFKLCYIWKKKETYKKEFTLNKGHLQFHHETIFFLLLLWTNEKTQ